MNFDRAANILLSPHVTEKATLVGDTSNQFVFKVIQDANKGEIKHAVETMFNVEVDSVRTLKIKGKTKRFGTSLGKRKNWKKAYVRLKPGHDIDFIGGE
ncbi:MAG: 50S ribosomal protein L23 [Gammaproteobacteria bacterium]|jgi:large subunit ribosomal protein L23|nr:50S ribosomal protein L23 [Gammaproteobacteria bacterium]